jgi:cytosine/adenosine deaminase-related metal-dependent hydrolase
MLTSDPFAAPITVCPRWTWYRGQFVTGLRVTIQNAGIIRISTERESREIDRSDLLLLPGLVNAHTHLEFSSLNSPIPHDGTFASWIRAVVQWRRGQTEADHLAALQRGLSESAAAGVAALGEISTRSQQVLRGDTPYQVSFREALGLSEASVHPQLEIARSHLVASADPLSYRPGLSPHAPYSLHCDLFQGIVDLAQAHSCPLAMHLAETEEELELLRTGTGPLADLFAEWGLWRVGQTAPFRKPIEVLRTLRELPNVLVIHGNYLDTEELDYLAGRDNFTVVFCPRTHSYFGHRRYPITGLLRRGIRVALGTDSRASNPDLNLLSDLRHAARQHPEIAPESWIEMITHNGARALGLSRRFGTMTDGANANLCALTIPPGTTDPLEVVLESGQIQSS